MSDLKTLEALNRDYISSVQNGDVRRFEAHDVLIRRLGDVAIIHATTTYKRPEGQPGAGRYTDVWARQGGRWLAVSAHVTRC